MPRNSNNCNLTKEEREKIRSDKRNAGKRLKRQLAKNCNITKARGIGGYRVGKPATKPRPYKRNVLNALSQLSPPSQTSSSISAPAGIKKMAE